SRTLQLVSYLHSVVPDAIEPAHIRPAEGRQAEARNLRHPDVAPDRAVRKDAVRAHPRPRRNWIGDRQRDPVDRRAPVFCGWRENVDIYPDLIVRGRHLTAFPWIAREVDPLDWYVETLHHPRIVQARQRLARDDTTVEADDVPFRREASRTRGVHVVGWHFEPHRRRDQPVGLQFGEITEN